MSNLTYEAIVAEINKLSENFPLAKAGLDAFERGRVAEQERIIKLLEELDDEEWMGINQNFIALIKEGN